MTKASENQFPSILAVNTSNASISNASPWNAQRLFFDADGTLKRKDSGGTVTAVEGGGSITFGGVASTDTVSVASNFAVSDQGGGEARLDVFFPSSGGISAGSSFPVSPATNDLYFHTTYQRLFFYDGTRWLSADRFQIPLFITSASSLDLTGTTTAFARGVAMGTEFDLWLEDWNAHSWVLTTNDGSNYWTGEVRKVDHDNGTSSQIASFVTSSDTAGTPYHKRVAINAALGVADGYQSFFATATKTASPGNMRFIPGFITARAIGT